MKLIKRYFLIFTAALMTLLPACHKNEPELTVITHDTDVSASEDVSDEISETEIRIPEGMVTRYASLDFDKRMQEAYDGIVDTITGYEKKSLIPLTVSTKDYSKILGIVRCEQLAFFYLENRTVGDYNSAAQTFEMDFQYKYTIKEVNTMLRQTEEEAKKIIALTDDSMSDYEKLKLFHDYLVRNVESSVDSEHADSIYGALVEKQALCEGYAKAFSYLCNLSGIENMIVTGFTEIDHMWNMVKLDGKWYHIDIGWDKPAEALTARCPDMVLYQYFLASDSVIQNDHRSISRSLGDPPAADSDDMSYFVHEGKYAHNYDEALAMIEDTCRSCIDSGQKYFMIKLDSSNLYLSTLNELTRPSDDEGNSDIRAVADRLGYKGNISYTDYYKNYRILIFILD
ncbi:MAG: hypothetical protein J6I96_02475 [Oscillospiraceae bacterium]|nr:hypothetical protein [Oscillospiraceae bacterium]